MQRENIKRGKVDINTFEIIIRKIKKRFSVYSISAWKLFFISKFVFFLKATVNHVENSTPSPWSEKWLNVALAFD